MDRRCGDCTLCCTVTRVPEFDKPVGETCVFCKRGCSIYSTRPKSCRNFECAWLKGNLPRWMRPHRVHFVIEELPNAPVVLVLIEPGYEHKWLTPEVDAFLKSHYQERGVAVASTTQQMLVPEGRTPQEVLRDVRDFAKSAGVAA